MLLIMVMMSLLLQVVVTVPGCSVGFRIGTIVYTEVGHCALWFSLIIHNELQGENNTLCEEIRLFTGV